MTRAEFDNLVHNLSRNLYGFAYRILKDQEASEDAVQEVFIKLWKMKSKLGEYKSIEALAVTMIRNQCIDQLRKQKAGRKNEDSMVALNNNSGLSPQDQLEMSETISILNKIINGLPEIYRQVIMLRDIDELNYEEIAEKTGQNVNTLRVNLSRARKMVREKYKSYYNDESRGN